MDERPRIPSPASWTWEKQVRATKRRPFSKIPCAAQQDSRIIECRAISEQSYDGRFYLGADISGGGEDDDSKLSQAELDKIAVSRRVRLGPVSATLVSSLPV